MRGVKLGSVGQHFSLFSIARVNWSVCWGQVVVKDDKNKIIGKVLYRISWAESLLTLSTALLNLSWSTDMLALAALSMALNPSNDLRHARVLALAKFLEMAGIVASCRSE